MESRDLSRLYEGLSEKEDSKEVIGKTSRLLAELTQMAGIVTLPKRETVYPASHRIFAPVQCPCPGDLCHQ